MSKLKKCLPIGDDLYKKQAWVHIHINYPRFWGQSIGIFFAWRIPVLRKSLRINLKDLKHNKEPEEEIAHNVTKLDIFKTSAIQNCSF